jgi:hypothetical protein
MPFELAFHPEALREWRKLTPGIREQFKNKLAERLTEPRIPASKLRVSCDRHKTSCVLPAAASSTRCVTTSCWCWELFRPLLDKLYAFRGA